MSTVMNRQDTRGSILFRLGQALRSWPGALARRRQEREEWERLLTLDDYLLDDMGLDRAQIRRRLGIQPAREHSPYGRLW